MAVNITLWKKRADQAEKNADRLIERYAKKYGHNFTINDLTREESKRLMYWLKLGSAALGRIINDEVKRGIIKRK